MGKGGGIGVKKLEKQMINPYPDGYWSQTTPLHKTVFFTCRGRFQTFPISKSQIFKQRLKNLDNELHSL